MSDETIYFGIRQCIAGIDLEMLMAILRNFPFVGDFFVVISMDQHVVYASRHRHHPLLSRHSRVSDHFDEDICPWLGFH